MVFVTVGERSCGDVSNGGVRLVGGASALEGRVELCLDGVWGTVCDNFWSNLDAIVVCNQLSLGKTDAVAIQGARFGAGTGPIHLNNFFCSGTESILTNCPHQGTEDSSCSHLQDASVICSGMCMCVTCDTASTCVHNVTSPCQEPVAPTVKSAWWMAGSRQREE